MVLGGGTFGESILAATLESMLCGGRLTGEGTHPVSRCGGGGGGRGRREVEMEGDLEDLTPEWRQRTIKGDFRTCGLRAWVDGVTSTEL